MARSTLMQLFFSVFICLCLIPDKASAYTLSARGTRVERSLAAIDAGLLDRIFTDLAARGAGIKIFKEPVHEEITHRVFGCNGAQIVCGEPDSDFATPYVLAGVRWNDDPPFKLDAGQASNLKCKTSETIRFTTQPLCWYQLFQDAGKRAARGEKLNADTRASLLGRSHYGDLQFIHAMASGAGEDPRVTRDNILMWAEFTWGVATGVYDLGTQLSDITIPNFSRYFGRSAWTVQDLFTLGNPTLRADNRVREVAFGSLLHMVQDSFANGHVDRREPIYNATCAGTASLPSPGKVKEFHSYSGQISSKHNDQDTRDAFERKLTGESPTVVDVGRAIRSFWRGNPAPATWADVRPYFECIFNIDNNSQPSSAGAEFAALD